MDLANNEAGYQIAQENPNATNDELVKLVLQALQEGDLQTEKGSTENVDEREEYYEYVDEEYAEDLTKTEDENDK